MIGEPMNPLSTTTQWVVVIATIIEIMAWCAMAWAIRYYAPYRGKDE
tara:strand:- start:2160 stop:2300 length:141 start_codon:yes stop_codon:yes gene_type:complete